jgi:hypothetical protein
MAKANENADIAQTNKQEPSKVPVRWDDTNLKSSYANVCNVSSTRSEVVLVFGINEAWERGQPEIKVELSNRIILSPVAAKQLSDLLSRVVGEYETRFGQLFPERKESVPQSA